MKKTIITLLAAALAPLAVADDKGGKSKDGKRPEPAELAQKMLDKLDTDKSDDVSLTEFKTGMAKKMEDADAEKRFTTIDTDSDGAATLKEMTAALEARKDKGGKGKGGKGKGGPGKGKGGPGKGGDKGEGAV